MKTIPQITVQLVHIEGPIPIQGKINEFNKPLITIGRYPDRDLCFPKDLAIISRKHARIEREGNRFKLIDENSGNGTFIKGKRIQEAFLNLGDVISFAETDSPKIAFYPEVNDDIQQTATPVSAQAPPMQAAPAQAPPMQAAPAQAPPMQAAPAQAPPMQAAPAQAPPVRPAIPQNADPLQHHVQEVSQPSQIQPAAPESPDGIAGQQLGANRHPVNDPGPDTPEITRTRLVVVAGPDLEEFNALPITIGSNPTSHVKLNCDGICEQHVQIFFHQGQYWVKNLTGQDIMVINGMGFNLQMPLKPGDKLALTHNGPVFEFYDGGSLVQMSEDVKTGEHESPPGNEEQTPQASPRKEVKKRKSLLNRFF
ncbi:FHA domain-containing protein [Desulfobacterales bacterium HSG16]|nr:FHA domain-containing protein [Desulfobacterales bacterium HSG16]